jgi:DNA-binding HxlR family transcriptional regulator
MTSLTEAMDVLARRGALAVVDALTGPALDERALVRQLAGFAPSVVAQRVADLRRLGAVEEVPETGALRLSPHGRRLLGVLAALATWAEGR